MADGKRLKLTESDTKRRKKDKDSKRRASQVNIGTSIDKWTLQRNTLGIDNETLAAVLLDIYAIHQSCKVVALSPILATSTPAHVPKPGKIDYESESDGSYSDMSGVEMLKSIHGETSFVQEAVGDVCSDICSGSLRMIDSCVYEEDTLVDSSSDDFHDDPDDLTWEPSIRGIRLAEDSFLDYDQIEDHPADMVFDTDFNQDDGLESDEEEAVSVEKGKFRRDRILRENNPTDAASADKCIAYKSCIQQLSEMQVSHNCPVKGCREMVISTLSKKGTAFLMSWVCSKGHQVRTWSSQPKLPRGILAGDFSLACSILLSGNNYGKVALMLKFLRLGCINPSSFWRIQTLYCTPTINTFWEKKLGSVIEGSKGKDLVIAGDGRMDSPGFSAKYCTYTVLNLDTLDILAVRVVDKREVGLKSPNMELKAFKDALKELSDKGLSVTEIVTDAHPSISAYMRKEQPDIKHKYDVWHGAKNLAKKLTAVASYKVNKSLVPWRTDIVNHFWNACQTCNGDEVLLRNKWTGVVHHIVNEHEWALGACEHENLDRQDKAYLEPGSPAHRALTELVFEDRFLRNLAYYASYRSTAELEGFQNHILMYAGKRFAYSYPVYMARCQLAALDYQMHKDRPGKKNKHGDQIWHRGYNINSARWRAVAVKVQKTYSYMPDLLTEIFRSRIEDTGSISRHVELLENDPRRIAGTIAATQPDATAHIVAAHVTRRKHSDVP